MIDFSSHETWNRDPRHVAFTLARYHFVAKMLHGMEKVAEVGAGDGQASRIVEQAVGALFKFDLKPAHHVAQWDISRDPLYSQFDGLFALDVLEHISPAKEHRTLEHICKSLTEYGTCIIGMPSKESQIYASELSKEEHVNCKTEDELRALMQEYFHRVFMLGMNDTTLHCGFGPMCQYRLAIATCKR